MALLQILVIPKIKSNVKRRIQKKQNTVTSQETSFLNEISGGTQILRNIGMTKATTPKASNPLMIEDIFDVYTRQVDQMSSYNAFVVPLSDMQKWLNYRGGEEGQINIKSSIEAAYGEEAVQYIRQLMEDINGVGSNDRYFARDLIGRFKASAVGSNLRVVIQQPTSYMRVMNEMNPKYMSTLEGLGIFRDTGGSVNEADPDRTGKQT